MWRMRRRCRHTNERSRTFDAMTHEKNIRTIISSWWTQLRTQDSLMTVEKIITSDDGNKQVV